MLYRYEKQEEFNQYLLAFFFFSYFIFHRKKKIKRLIKNDKIRDLDVLRLLSLYALRYERHASNEFDTLKYEAQKYRKLPEKYIHV